MLKSSTGRQGHRRAGIDARGLVNPSLAGRRGSLTEAVMHQLTQRIDEGTYGAGDKIPSEHALCREFGVSRTVVREAVASLRLGGRLTARQGVGVFVPDDDGRRLDFVVPPGRDLRDALQILELRLAVEVEAVGLAAQRRTLATLSELTAAFDRFNALDGPAPQDLAEADFAFHLALARATGNPHFPQFLEALGPDIIFDLTLKHQRLSDQKTRRSYLKKSGEEHGAILSAISQGNGPRARTALKRHLNDGLARYRRVVGDAAAS